MEKTEKAGFGKNFLDGLFFKNPFFVLFFGLTLVMVSTNRLEGAFLVGILTAIEFLFVQLVISILKKHLDRVGAYLTALLISAGLSTLYGILFGLVLPEALTNLIFNGQKGAFLSVVIPFLCSTSFVLDQADEPLTQSFKETRGYSLGSALGYLLDLLLIALLREVFVTGAIVFHDLKGVEHGLILFDKNKFSLPILDKPFGGFLFAGLLMGGYRSIVDLVLIHKQKKARNIKEAE